MMKTRNSLAELRQSLQATADALYKRRACDIPESYIEDYVLLDWLKWDGGGLKLTPTGQSVCQQAMHRPEASRAKGDVP